MNKRMTARRYAKEYLDSNLNQPAACLVDFRDKEEGLDYHVDTMLNKTLTMFQYTELPDSIPERDVEMILQINGYCIIAEHEGKLLALWGGFAPPLDAYYKPTKVIVNNPWAKIDKTFTIGEDCVLIKNDPLMRGMMPILERFGSMLVENDLTTKLAITNLRAIFALIANSDQEKDSCEEFLRNIEAGNPGVIMGEEWSAGDGKINTQPFATQTSGYITQLIEMNQYLKGSFLNEVGLNANYNMKRERLSSNETELNEDCLRPLIDSMLEEREKGWKAANEMFGCNTSVLFNSSWSKYNNPSVEVKEEVVEEVTDDVTEEVTDDSTEVVEEVTEDVTNEVTDDSTEVVEEVTEDVTNEVTEITMVVEGDVTIEEVDDDEKED